MYSASSSRHRDRRNRSARQIASQRRPLLEALESRQLLAAAEVQWAKVTQPQVAAASDGGDVFVTDHTNLTEYINGQRMGSIPTTATVMAATNLHAYTNEVAKYSVSGGLHVEWSHPDFPNVNDVAAAPDGSVYIAGTYTQAFDADPGPGTRLFPAPTNFAPDAYLVKLDAAGNFLWADDIGNDVSSGYIDPQHPIQLEVDAAGNSYFAVNYARGPRPPYAGGGIQLVKLDAAGHAAWSETIGSYDSWVTGLAVGPTGEVAVTGVGNMQLSDLQPRPGTPGGEHWPDGTSYGTGGSSFVARYDTSGALSWARRPLPNSFPQSSGSAADVDVTLRGDVIAVVGAKDGVAAFSLLQRYDALGNLINQQAYDAQITSVVSNGGFTQLLLTGTFSGTVDINPGYNVTPVTAPAGTTTAGVVFQLIDPVGGPQRLLGTPIGTPGSWNNSGNDFTKALDNDTSTYFDAPTSQAYAGYDFGHPTIVDNVAYRPRAGYESRMVGGQFQGSNDGSAWTTVATITATPAAGVTTRLNFAAPVTYRYMRYLSPVDGYGNAAEISFFGAGPEAWPPDVPLHPVASWDGARIRVNWTDLATNETLYRAELFDNPNFTGTPLATAERGPNFYFLTFPDFNTPGTYYVRVRAANTYNISPWASAGPVTVPGTPVTQPPAAPTNLTVTPVYNPGGTALDMSWTDNATNETAYHYEVYVTNGDLVMPFASGTLPANTISFSIPVDNVGRYTVAITAENAAGSSDPAPSGLVIVDSPYGHRLTGTPFGSPGSYNNSGNTFLKVFDNELTSFFDAPTPDGNFAGMDFGTPAKITRITYYPRAGQAARMVGGQFRGSNDNSTWTTLATISSAPTGLTTISLPGTTAYRYVEYLSPAGSYGNVAEVTFYGTTSTADTNAPKSPTNLAYSASAEGLTFTWEDPFPNFNATGFLGQLSTSPDFDAAHTQTVNLARTARSYTFTNLPAGTYYFRVAATGSSANSPFYTSGAIDFTAPTARSISGSFTGTAGSWNNSGNTIVNAFDNDTSTYFDGPTADGNVIILQYSGPTAISFVRVAPRAGFADRMVGAQIQGSNDNTTWTTLATITTAPPSGVLTDIPVHNPTPYRYVRYLAPAGSYGNIAEFDPFGTASPSTPLPNNTPSSPTPPGAPTNLQATLQNRNTLRYTWSDVFGETAYQYDLSTSSDFHDTIQSGNLPANATFFQVDSAAPGTYFFRLRATNDAGSSAYTVADALQVQPMIQLHGAAFGSPGSYNNSGNTFDKALDGNPNTFFDAPTASGNFVGMNAGFDQITRVAYTARAGYEWRMPGGQFQGSNDGGKTWSTFHTITAAPAAGATITVDVPNSASYGMVRYLSPNDSYGNIAELAFYGFAATAIP